MIKVTFVTNVYLCWVNFYRPPNSDELNIDCLPVGDSPRKPHNLRVLQSDTSKLRKQIKMLTVSFNWSIFIHTDVDKISIFCVHRLLFIILIVFWFYYFQRILSIKRTISY